MEQMKIKSKEVQLAKAEKEAFVESSPEMIKKMADDCEKEAACFLGDSSEGLQRAQEMADADGLQIDEADKGELDTLNQATEAAKGEFIAVFNHQPKFIRDFSKEHSQEDRNTIAKEIWEKRSENKSKKIELNNRENELAEKLADMGELEKTIADLSETGLSKIKNYFKLKSLKAELLNNNEAYDELQDGEIDVPDMEEPKQMLQSFYDSERKRWENSEYTPEDIEKQFSEEHLKSLSLEDYALLMKRFPCEMVTHVTRQGVRDHASSHWHTAGMGNFSNGFKKMLEGGRLHSSIGIALQEHSKDDAMAKFLRLDNIQSRDDALAMYENKFEHDCASGDAAFADSAAIHVASEIVMDHMYGSERGNEIFIAYPSAYVASQLNFGGKGKLTDRSFDQHNDKSIYTKDQEGMPLDAGLVFIPGDAKVDSQTGSRYRVSEKGELIIPKKRINEVLEARFGNLGFVQKFFQKLPYQMREATEEDREILAEEAFSKFGITDAEVKKALVDIDLIKKLNSKWGQDSERGDYEEILMKYFHNHTDDPYELADNPITSKDYWEKYFQENPGQQPSKIVYYSGGDPSDALDEWRKKEGIAKKTSDPRYGFSDHEISGSSEYANMGKDRFASYARKVIDDRFPKV